MVVPSSEPEKPGKSPQNCCKHPLYLNLHLIPSGSKCLLPRPEKGFHRQKRILSVWRKVVCGDLRGWAENRRGPLEFFLHLLINYGYIGAKIIRFSTYLMFGCPFEWRCTLRRTERRNQGDDLVSWTQAHENRSLLGSCPPVWLHTSRKYHRDTMQAAPVALCPICHKSTPDSILFSSFLLCKWYPEYTPWLLFSSLRPKECPGRRAKEREKSP